MKNTFTRPSTVTVTYVDGSTFTAPSRGKVLAKDLELGLDVINYLYNTNMDLIEDGQCFPEKIKQAEDTQKKINAAFKENREFYRTLDTVYDLRNKKRKK